MKRLITIILTCLCIINTETEARDIIMQDTLIVPDECTIYVNTSKITRTKHVKSQFPQPIWGYFFGILPFALEPKPVIIIEKWAPSCPLFVPIEESYKDKGAALLYKKEFGNGTSTAFTVKGKYYRQDKYEVNKGSGSPTEIRVTYYDVPENLRAIADNALNTIRIVSKDSAETCGCRPGGTLGKDKTCHNNRECRCSSSCDCKKRTTIAEKK